ncbi:MAG: hypothetical protein AAF497_13610, partial [Planctomycetota bacterium]
MKAPKDAPVYKLSNLRLEDDVFGRAAVVCDYKRTKEGTGRYGVSFVARTEDGEVPVMGMNSLLDRESGELRLTKHIAGFGSRKYNYEIYLVTNANWAGKSYGPFKISNSVRMGNPGPATKAREWTVGENEAYGKHKLSASPPKEAPPSGYQLATSSTKLLPGMPVMAGRYSEWVPAEFMGYNFEGDAQLRFGSEKKMDFRPVDKWVAVEDAVLKRSKDDPDSFEPSALVLKGSYYVLPPDVLPVDDSMELVPGTPLLTESLGKWRRRAYPTKSAWRSSTRSPTP